MFSLIITIISIALVALLALATLYYGGSAFSQGSAKAEAGKLLIQGQQLLGAAELYKADRGDWPASIDELVSKNYLKSIPVATLQNNTAVGEAVAAMVPWEMSPGKPVFIIRPFAGGSETCQHVNLQGSLKRKGILKSAYGELTAQCYGVSNEALRVVFKKSVEDPLAPLIASSELASGAVADIVAGDWNVNPGGTAVVVAEPSAVLPAGVGTNPITQGGLTLSYSSMTFPRTLLGQSFSPNTYPILTNNSGAPVTLTAVTMTGSTESTMNLARCAWDTVIAGELAIGESCLLTVEFTPTTVGTHTTTGTINGLSLTMTGEGYVPPPLLDVVTELSLNAVLDANGNSGVAMSITHISGDPLTQLQDGGKDYGVFYSIKTGSKEAQAMYYPAFTDSSPFSVYIPELRLCYYGCDPGSWSVQTSGFGGGSRTAKATLPTPANGQSGLWCVTWSAANADQYNSYTGTGIAGPCAGGTNRTGVVLSTVLRDNRIVSDYVEYSDSETTQVVAVNTGNTTWTNGLAFSLSVTGFTHSVNNCVGVAPQGTCTINVTFTPPDAAGGTYSGPFAARVTAGGLSASATGVVEGIGTPTIPRMELSGYDEGSNLYFGNVSVGSSLTRLLTVTNTGRTSWAAGIALTSSKDEFSGVSQGCVNLAPLASCVVQITFTPLVADSHTEANFGVHTVGFVYTASGYAYVQGDGISSGGGLSGGGSGGGTPIEWISDAGVNVFEVPINNPYNGSCSGDAHTFNVCTQNATAAALGKICNLYTIEPQPADRSKYQTRLSCV